MAAYEDLVDTQRSDMVWRAFQHQRTVSGVAASRGGTYCGRFRINLPNSSSYGVRFVVPCGVGLYGIKNVSNSDFQSVLKLAGVDLFSLVSS